MVEGGAESDVSNRKFIRSCHAHTCTEKEEHTKSVPVRSKWEYVDVEPVTLERIDQVVGLRRTILVGHTSPSIGATPRARAIASGSAPWTHGHGEHEWD